MFSNRTVPTTNLRFNLTKRLEMNAPGNIILKTEQEELNSTQRTHIIEGLIIIIKVSSGYIALLRLRDRSRLQN